MRIRLVLSALILSTPLLSNAAPLTDSSASNHLFELERGIVNSDEIAVPLQLRTFVESLQFLLADSSHKLVQSFADIQMSAVRAEIRDISAPLAQLDENSF